MVILGTLFCQFACDRIEFALSCSEDGTTAWCGISILPLSYIIPTDVAKERKELQTSSYGEQLIIVSSEYKERLLVEVEPQVSAQTL